MHRSRSQSRVILRPMDLLNTSLLRAWEEELDRLFDYHAPTLDSLSKWPSLASFSIHRTRALPRCRADYYSG